MVREQAAVAAEPFAPAVEKFEEIVTHLQSDKVQTMTHGDFERELEKEGRELLRRLYQGYLKSRGPGEAQGPVVGADGIERTRPREQERTLTSIFGDVKVTRMGYGAEGVESLRPLDAELNLPPVQYSHRVQQRVAEEAAKNSFDEVVKALEQTNGAKVPKRQAEEVVGHASQDFDLFYEDRKTKSPEVAKGSLLVLSVDGKGVVMRHEDLREATKKAAEQRTHKMDKRLSPGEKRHAKRMATVAAVYTVAPFVRTPEDIVKDLAPVREVPVRRPKPENKRVWASLERTPEQVIEEAFKEARHRDPQQERKWVALVDGNETQLELLGKMAQRFAVSVLVVMDVIHVLEYLWKAAYALHGRGRHEVEAWVTERFHQILKGKAVHVAAGIRRSATKRQLSGEQRAPVDGCADYLLKYQRYLRYDEYLAAGLPIATGVIEGACRHLIKDRMDLTGARWSLKGAEAVLRLRALRSSGDFEEYWHFHEAREQERHHTAHYAQGHVPPTQTSHPGKRRSRLRIVK